MPGLYYLISWKSYLKEKNIWEPSLAVIHLQKLINNFYKECPEKPIVTSLPLDSVLLIARFLVPKEPKQKHSCLSKEAKKRGKN